MTDLQRKFIEAYLKSGDAEESAVVAGYSKRGARKAAWRLLAHAEVAEAISKRRPPAVTQGPLEYLEAVLNDPEASVARRTRAALALLPYRHEKAKSDRKAEAQSRAKVAASGKFKPADGPKVLPFERKPK